MSVRGVIFDLGDTLIYFDAAWDDAVNRARAGEMAAFFTRKRIELDEAALVETFFAGRQAGRTMAQRTNLEVTCSASLRAALEKIHAPSAAFRLVPEAVRIYFQYGEAAWKAYPDAHTTLRHLYHQGYRLGVVSNATDDPLIQRVVNRLGLRPWLSPVFTSAGLGVRKPLRAPFDLVLSRWGLPPEAVVMVGDTPSADVAGAHAAGMRAVLITTGEGKAEDEPHPSIVPEASISALSQLPELLERWQA
jgi:HAD superfamily hydrolase (TIGR01662 family)